MEDGKIVNILSFYNMTQSRLLCLVVLLLLEFLNNFSNLFFSLFHMRFCVLFVCLSDRLFQGMFIVVGVSDELHREKEKRNDAREWGEQQN